MTNPLENNKLTKLFQSFTFWFTFFKKGKEKQLDEFEESLKEIGSISTAEEFWGIYQHMKRPTVLPCGASFYLFRKNVLPEENKQKFGKFILQPKKNEKLNKIWEDLQIAMILTDEKLSRVAGVSLEVKETGVFIYVVTGPLNDTQVLDLRKFIKESIDVSADFLVEFIGCQDGNEKDFIIRKELGEERASDLDRNNKRLSVNESAKFEGFSNFKERDQIRFLIEDIEKNI